MTDSWTFAKECVEQARQAVEGAQVGDAGMTGAQQQRVNNLLLSMDRELITVRELAAKETPVKYKGG